MDLLLIIDNTLDWYNQNKGSTNTIVLKKMQSRIR